MEVIRYFSTVAKNAPAVHNLSLFGQQVQKVRHSPLFRRLACVLKYPIQSEVAEELLGFFNHELAFKVMQEFRLPMAPIYVNAIAKIAGKKQVSRIFDLLKNVKGSVDDKEWDEVRHMSISLFFKSCSFGR